MKTTVHNFESIGDYVRYVTETKQKHSLVEGSDSRQNGDKFYGDTKSLAEAVSLVEKGWPEGAAKVADWSSRLSSFLSAATSAKSRSYHWDVTGDYVDIGKFLTGEPECCGSDAEYGEQLSGRVVTIRLNACVSGGLQADAIVARGVAVLVAVDILESLGKRCEVIVSQATSTYGRGGDAGSVRDLHLDANVTVKRAGEPVDLDRLAYSVAHPAFFRRLGFRFMELGGHSPSGCTVSQMSDYGKRQGVVEVDSLLTYCSLNEQSLREHILQILTAVGVDFTPEQLAEIASSTT